MTNVKLTTSLGEITLELDEAKAPVSVENFLKYVDSGHYNGTIFHRVMPNFMIQGGGFSQDMAQKPVNKPITNEWQNGLENKRGTIAMARTSDPNSATAQFFINVVDNDFLSHPRQGVGYAVFGRVASGMEVVDAIKDVPTGTRMGHENVPKSAVVITKAERV